MASFTRIPGKFSYKGMNVHMPPDRMPPNRCPFLFNVQPDVQDGSLFVRPPIAQIATTSSGLPVHSLTRLNDSVPEATKPYARFLGAGGNIYYGQSGAFAALDSGYSGNPLAFVPYRPAQSPESAVYTYDSAKQMAYKTDGTTRNIGIASPSVPPTSTVDQPLYTVVEDAASTGNWSSGTTSGGTTAGPSLVNRVPAGITISAILYDTGSSGWCSIVPSADSSDNYNWMTGGSRITINSAETVTIQDAFPAGYSTTVAAIHYDSGSTGLCTIVPAVPLPGLARNMTLYLNGATYVRVLSVTAGPDASYSFRCSTGATTISATQTITAPASFRVWTSGTYSASQALAYSSIQFVFTPSMSGGAMQDIVATNPGIGSTLDLSQINGARPTQNEDYMHVSLLLDKPEFITEVHFMVGLDEATGNNFGSAGNYLYYVVRQGDFQSSISGLTGTTQQSTLESQLDALSSQISSTGVSEGIGENAAQPPYPTPQVPSTSAPASQQLNLGGGAAWTEIMFKISDMTRVGTNPSLTLNNVVKLAIYFFVNGGVVTAQFGGWWVGGGYGPDCNYNSYGNQGTPIQWRYRYRNSLTGAHSTVSPEVLNGELVRRQAVVVRYTSSPDSQVDTIDWERRGGTNPDWHFVGSNPATQGYFLDTITESAAEIGDPLEVTSYQPWPVTDVPHSGTALVVGTSVIWQTGDKFNTQWLRGTEIIIAGNTYSLYAPPSSTTTLTLAENVVPPSGTYTFQIPEATIESQPLYGAWLDEANNRVLAVGDPLNPGLLYFTNVDNPDGASDSGYIEITSPSDPLLNGFYNEGSNYVFTYSGLYRVESTPGAVNPYAAYRLSGVEGMAGPWAFDARRRWLFYWGPDGIYGYQFGPAANNLTAQDLYPLFPHAGQLGQQGIPGVAVSLGGQTIYPPNYMRPNQLRVAYAESFVYASYINSVGGTESLVYSLDAGGWRKDTYTPNVTQFLLEQGIPNPALLAAGYDGALYQVANGSGPDTAGAVTNAINWVALTPCFDAGESRATKQWGDLMLDYSGKFCVQVLFDNLLVSGASSYVTVETQRTHNVFDLVSAPDVSDLPVIHYNMALLLTGDCPAYLYEWQPSFIQLPEDTTARVSTWQRGFSPGFKWINGVIIHADTYGQAKQVYVEYDDGSVSATFTVNHDGEQVLPYYFTPIYAHELRIVPVDDTPWHLWDDDLQWIGNVEPEYGGAMAVNWVNCGSPHYKFVQGFRLHADTFGVSKQIQIQYEGGVIGPTLTINHTGEMTLPYSWTPFKAHLCRIVPLDSVPWRYWADTEWLWEPEPDPANYWISQPTAFGLNGFLHAREMWLPFALTTPGAVVSVIVDGGSPVTLVTLLSEATPIKTYVPLPPVKGKYWQLTATGTGLQIYESDLEFLIKEWGSTGPYRRIRPFGDVSGGRGASGARI